VSEGLGVNEVEIVNGVNEVIHKNEEENSSLFLETIYFRILIAGCPNLWCHSDKDVLLLEKASKGEDTDHSYTSSLVLPFRSVAPVQMSLTRKVVGKNSMET